LKAFLASNDMIKGRSTHPARPGEGAGEAIILHLSDNNPSSSSDSSPESTLLGLYNR
jgi:hypothetical protein